jgi:dihydrofolate reductase
MARLTLDISMSLDGFIAGPNRTVEQPLGDGGERLHEWIVGLGSFRERHGMSGGERNANDEVARESLDSAGAVLMGRRMFSGGEGPWEDDPVADGSQQCLNAGLLDQMQIHLVPAFLGAGVRLFDRLGDRQRDLEVERASTPLR